jgi:hypothetical protein
MTTIPAGKKPNPLFAITLLLGALLWNGWVFGWLNHGLAGYFQMSISELEAVGQPNASLFNILEDASGLLLIVGALGLLLGGAVTKLTRKRGLPSLLLSLILLATMLIGALTLYDVAHPLDCNRYHDPACVAKIDAHPPQLSHTNMLHQTESTVTAYVTGVLVLLIALWAYMAKLPRAQLTAVTTLAIITILALIILDISTNVLAGAISERVWNVLVSLDIGFVALKLIRQRVS